LQVRFILFIPIFVIIYIKCKKRKEGSYLNNKSRHSASQKPLSVNKKQHVKENIITYDEISVSGKIEMIIQSVTYSGERYTLIFW
jgi:hypothetical protein